MSPWQIGLLVFFVEGGVKRQGAGREIYLPYEISGLGAPMDAIHSDIFPLHGEWAAVANVVKGDDDLFEVDVTMPE